MARLAFISSLVPISKPDTGFEIANRAILGALVRAGHEVAVLGFARPDDQLDPAFRIELIDRMVIENHLASPARKALWLGAALARGLPVTCAKLWWAGRGRVQARLAALGPFDALVFNSITMAGAFPELSELAPFLLVEHNVEHVSAAQNAERMGGLEGRLFAREARLLERIERETCARARFVWFLAEEDRAAFARECGATSAVLPLTSAAALPDAAPAPAPAPAHDVGLIGTWTWQPNLIGLSWFLDEVVPRLPGDIRIAIAGRLPEGVKREDPRLIWAGRVPDAADFLRAGRATALVSRAGTGIQLKTIEALELGLPAVATHLSLRGIALRPGNIRVADEPAEFAAALAGLVAEARAGRVGPADGRVFAAAQAAALDTALARGLAALD